MNRFAYHLPFSKQNPIKNKSINCKHEILLPNLQFRATLVSSQVHMQD
jgi:hypothetical protein